MAVVLLRSIGGRYTTQITSEHHSLVADEPRPAGDDLGMSPYELLLGALGACTSMTLMMYARRRGWPLAEVQIELVHDRDYEQDCEDCEGEGAHIEAIRRRIHLEGPLTDEQRDRLLLVAAHCPVHKTLAAAPRVVDSLF